MRFLKRSLILFCIVVIFSGITPFAVHGIEDNEGWPVYWQSGGGCPLVVDFDGDGYLDVITGSNHGGFAAWDRNGNSLDGWPKELEDDAQRETAGGDIDNDGQMEVVIAIMPWPDTLTTLTLMRSDGSELDGWPRTFSYSATVAPSLFDLDGDGKLEVFVSSATTDPKSRLHVFKHNGEQFGGWPLSVEGKCLETTPAVADLDLDGDLEVVFGLYKGYFPGTGWICAVHHDGTPVGDSLHIKQCAANIAVAPVSVVDVAGEQYPEIVACDDDGYVHILDYTGTPAPGWPQAERQGNQSNMIVAIDAMDGPAQAFWGESDWARSYIFDSTGNLFPNWPWYGPWGLRSQPIVGDLDGDAMYEAFLGGCYPYDVALEMDGSYVDGWPIYTGGNDFGSGTLTDLDGDGDTDIVFQDYRGYTHVYDTPGVYDYKRIECYRYMYDNWHTGSYHKDIYREAESADTLCGWSILADTTAWGHACLTPSPLTPVASAACSPATAPAAVATSAGDQATSLAASRQVEARSGEHVISMAAEKSVDAGRLGDRGFFSNVAYATPVPAGESVSIKNALVQPAIPESNISAPGISSRSKDGIAHPPVAVPAFHEFFYRTQVPVWEEYSIWARLRNSTLRAPTGTSSNTEVVAISVGIRFKAVLDDAPVAGANRTAPSPGDWFWYEIGRMPIEAGIHELRIKLPAGFEYDFDRLLFTTHPDFPLLHENPNAW